VEGPQVSADRPTANLAGKNGDQIQKTGVSLFFSEEPEFSLPRWGVTLRGETKKQSRLVSCPEQGKNENDDHRGRRNGFVGEGNQTTARRKGGEKKQPHAGGC